MNTRTYGEIQKDIILARERYEIWGLEEARQTIDELYVELAKKENGVYFAHRSLEDEINMLSDMEKKIKDKKKSLVAAQDRLKELTINAYKGTGKMPNHDILNPLKVQEGRGFIEIFDEDALPAAFKRDVVKIVPDKVKIREAIESGEKVPGARLVPSEFLKGL